MQSMKLVSLFHSTFTSRIGPWSAMPLSMQLFMHQILLGRNHKYEHFSCMLDYIFINLHVYCIISSKCFQLFRFLGFLFPISLYRVQLAVCTYQMVKHDFPGRWTTIVDKISIYLQNPDTNLWNGSLLCLYQLVKNFEWVARYKC